METKTSQDLHQSLFTPAVRSAVGIISGKWVAMRTDSISRTGAFMITKEYVRPRAVFEIMLWLEENAEPVHALVTATLLERTWEGYGVAVELSGTSEDNRVRWEQCYYQSTAANTPGYRDSFFTVRSERCKRVVVVEGALPMAALDVLARPGVELERVWSPERACKLGKRGDVDLIIASLNHGRYDGRELCRQLAEVQNGPRTLLITGRGTAKDFEDSLYAGAAKVIAQPCSPQLLVARIVAELHAAEEAELSYDFLPASVQKRKPSLLDQLSGQFARLWLNARIFFQSSKFDEISALTFS